MEQHCKKINNSTIHRHAPGERERRSHGIVNKPKHERKHTFTFHLLSITQIHDILQVDPSTRKSKHRCFCSSVCVQYNTRNRKSAINGEGLGTPITWMTSDGCEVDIVGGRCPITSMGAINLRACSSAYTERKSKNKKRGRPGNEARCCTRHSEGNKIQ